MAKKLKYIGPKENKNSISYMIFCYLKAGVSSREELVVNLHSYFKDNKIETNTKNRDITLKKIISNVNEILRYIFDKRPGWYSHYNLTQDEQELKINVNVRKKDGDKKDKVHE